MEPEKDWEERYKETFAGRMEELQKTWGSLLNEIAKELHLYKIIDWLQRGINRWGRRKE